MKQKPKILFIGRFPPPIHGAAAMNELYFNNKLINKNFTLKKIRLNKYESIEDIGTFNLKRIFEFFSNIFSLFHTLKSFNPNLIYFEIATNGIAFYRDSLYVFLCKIFSKKIIFHIHSRNLEKNFYSKFIFSNTKIIILSKFLINEVIDLFEKKDIHILPNGIPDLLNNKEFKKIIKKRGKNKKPVLLFLSNMIEEKGALDTLKICNELNKKNIDFECLFVGTWQDKAFEKKWIKQFEEYNLKNKCKYLGAKYGNEKKEIFEKTNFFIFPTTYKNESFPLVILEAFMFGIPVFSYDNGAIKEIISKDYLGKVVNKGDWEALTKKLIKKIKIKSQYNKIRNHFKKNYTIETASKKLLNIFKMELK